MHVDKMFSSLKFATLKPRTRNKDISETNNFENQYDDDERDVSCASSLKCQQSLNKCNTGNNYNKSPKSKQRLSNTSIPNTVPPFITELENYTRSEEYLPSERYFVNDSSMYVMVRKTDVFIKRDEEGNLGLTLQGGAHQNPELSRPLVVTYVRPGGPTDVEGTIQVGDRLLAVDGFPLDNLTLNEAYNILRNNNNRSSRLTIEYDVTNMKRFSGPLLVEMESPHPHQLGLTLTNTPHNAAVLIDEIKTASIAERCGALHSGDQILSVNDTRIEGSRMPATEVHKLLRICGDNNSNLLLQVLPASTFVQNHIAASNNTFKRRYSPNSHISLDTIYPNNNNCYEVPNEYLVPNVIENSINSKLRKLKKMTIVLHSEDRLGYGLSVYFSPKSNNYVVSSILCGGPADSCEQIQINDRISRINGRPVIEISTDSQPLHTVPGIGLGVIELEIEYDRYDVYDITSDNIFSIELTKYNKKNLGIAVADYDDYTVISEIKQGSVADRCGMLNIGDKILSINQQDLAKFSAQQVTDILNFSSNSVLLQIEKQVISNQDVDADDVGLENIEYTVQLNKQNGPIGITITGSEIIPKEITISALTPGGLAEKTGALHVGDRVLEIDNHNVKNVLLSKAINLLRNSSDKVLFKVSRNTSNCNRTYINDLNNRVYGSPGLISQDSAIESWESSTQRDISPNDSSFQHIQQKITNEGKCESNHVFAKIINAENNNHELGSEEHLYSNLPFHNASLNAYYSNSRYPLHQQNYKFMPNVERRSTSQHYHVNDPYYDSNYSKNDCSFSSVDEIFSITDLHDNMELNDAGYSIHQVVIFKDPLYEDFGFSISDGLYEKGVFINRIRQGGPVDSGLLQPFDRIIQVNNTITENLDCCLTVPLIASVGEKITLTVKRIKREPSIDSRINSSPNKLIRQYN